MKKGGEDGEAPQPPEDPQGELHADHEQQHEDAELGEDVDLLAVPDQGKAVGAEHDAGHDVANDGRLAQALEPEAADQRHQGDGGDAGEVCVGDGLHRPIVSRAGARRDGPHHRSS